MVMHQQMTREKQMEINTGKLTCLFVYPVVVTGRNSIAFRGELSRGGIAARCRDYRENTNRSVKRFILSL